ncbi:MAG: metallophosphoesterase [Nanoarchaeota archaeon]|nr:metallophosphoesterase [Nanoarchaeota archaeon]
MDQREILNFCIERGILLDKDVLSLFSEAGDMESVRLMIEKIRENTHQKVITKSIFTNGIKNITVENFPQTSQTNLERLKIRLGLELEISKEYSLIENKNPVLERNFEDRRVKVQSFPTGKDKKLDVDDFTEYFRNRFQKLKSVLQAHPNLRNLVSINKISGDRQKISIMGIVSDKSVTKNGNIILELEDLTGSTRVLINQNKKELYTEAEDLTLDAIIGISGSGNREIIFANELVLPDAAIPERKKSPVEEYAVFIGDLHYGSNLFMKKNFLKFLDYLNGKIPNTPEVSKIKYLFIVGDLIAGIGIYPEQEMFLDVPDAKRQFEEIAQLLGQIRKDITIIIIPGNHDCIRLMEPQPLLDKKYAEPLYKLENVILATNPCYVNMGAREGFPGFDVLMYHGFSFFYYADNIPSLIQADAGNAPEKIMNYLLKYRHLAPTHASAQYFPLNEDPLVIDKVPDVFFSGHTHKCGITFYNNVLIISGSTWEAKTPEQERRGNEPDFCKVPIMNLKTGGVKILDFE